MALPVETRNGYPEVVRLKRASIFPIASLLKTERDRGIIKIKDLIYTPRVSNITDSFLLTQAVRHTSLDNTGIVPYYLGVSQSPQETLRYMMPAATKALKWLENKGEKAYKETLEALLHNGPCSVDSLDYLDQMWGMTVGRVKNMAYDMGLAEYNGMTPEALEFKTENTESLKALKEKYSLEELVNRQLVEESGVLTDITEELTVPPVSKVQAERLLKILPDVFNRKKNVPIEHFRLEVQILRELGKVGNDLTRKIIMILRDKETQKLMDDHFSSRQ